MSIRLESEKLEEKNLSKYAMLSRNSIGRKDYEEKCNIRTDFQRDRDRIIHSKSFRRLKHKTQVFVAPKGDHFRTRLTHTLEVSQIGRTIARALRLNEDLVEAISLGHDLGHTPFGHTGERILDRLNPNGFNHNKQSLRIVDFLEHRSDRSGLNLTYEVREGIIKHSGENKPKTLEGQVVRYADRIAYINHDIDDAIRADIIKEEDLPRDCIKFLGKTHGQRINKMILDIITNSMEKSISMSEETKYYTDKLRKYMFDNVYLNKIAKSEETKAEYIIEELYKYYYNNNEELPKEHLKIYENIEDIWIEDIICDYIAGMTDRYVVDIFNHFFIPKPWKIY